MRPPTTSPPTINDCDNQRDCRCRIDYTPRRRGDAAAGEPGRHRGRGRGNECPSPTSSQAGHDLPHTSQGAEGPVVRRLQAEKAVRSWRTNHDYRCTRDSRDTTISRSGYPDHPLSRDCRHRNLRPGRTPTGRTGPRTTGVHYTRTHHQRTDTTPQRPTRRCTAHGGTTGRVSDSPQEQPRGLVPRLP